MTQGSTPPGSQGPVPPPPPPLGATTPPGSGLQSTTTISTKGNVTTPSINQNPPIVDLGAVELQSPIIRNRRRDSLYTTATLNAMHLHNELNGSDGMQFPITNPNNPARTLFPTATSQGIKSPGGSPSVPPNRTITVDGRPLTLKQAPSDKDKFETPRLWDKLTRHTLKGEEKTAFRTSVTGFVLSKSRKLSTISTKTDDEGLLKHVHSLELQLKQLKAHVIQHDIADVFTIMVPKDLSDLGELTTTPSGAVEAYDLFEDYSKLHKTIVANSNAWYNSWIHEDYVRENMSYSYTMLQKNTDESLWNKCLEDYEEFHPIQRGGPLMLFLILKRIQDTSESALETFKKQVRKLKISSIKGEDVDVAVSLIKSTYKILTGASTADRSYVPDDFNQTVVKVFQTTSVRDFNQTFKDLERNVLERADMYSLAPEWPTVSSLVNLATNSYSRMKVANKWHGTGSGKAAAFAAQTPDRSTTSSVQRPKRRCFGCGKDTHLLPDCPEPRDEARIAKNRAAFQKANPRNGSSRKGPLHKTSSDGKPLIRNKLGAYVLDQKQVRKEKETADLLQTLTDSSADSSPPTTPSTPATPSPPTTNHVTTQSARQTQRQAALDRIRAMLLQR